MATIVQNAPSQTTCQIHGHSRAGKSLQMCLEGEAMAMAGAEVVEATAEAIPRRTRVSFKDLDHVLLQTLNKKMLT